MKIKSTISIQVNCTVKNSKGDIAYDIYEFFLNDSPFVGNMSIYVAGNPNLVNPVFQVVNQLIMVQLGTWYDSADDKEL